MGSTNFRTIAIGKDVQDAYRKACDEAIEYAGHQDGYNGTISTTNGFSIYNDVPRYGTKAFVAWEEKTIDKLNKRGKCAVFEILGIKAKEIKERNGYKGKRVKVFCFIGWAAE